MRLVAHALLASPLLGMVKRSAASMASMQASDFINDVNTKYETLHRSFEEQARPQLAPPPPHA